MTRGTPLKTVWIEIRDRDMSSIRFGGVTDIPEVTVASDVGQTLDITNLNDFDLGFLGNRQKLASTPPRAQSPGITELTSDGIDFVNLEDTNATFNVKPTVPANNIQIIRDGPALPAKPIEPAFVLKSEQTQPTQPTQQTKSWFSPTDTNTTSAPAPAPAPATGFRSWFSGQQTTTDAQPVQSAYLTSEQEAIKKTECLTLLERLDRKGISGTKMTMANSLDEIHAELARRKDSKGLEASIRFQRSMLTTMTSGMEFLNNRYDPVGISIDGWSEQVNENIEDYDEIFEELYDKYKDKSKVAPEVRLIMSLGLSAAMCHVTNTMFKSRMPGMDDILRKNPELAKQMARAAAEQAVGPGFANFVSMGMGQGQQQGQQQQQQPQYSQQAFIPPQNEMSTGTARREMRGPTGVDDIIEKLNGETARIVPPGSFDAEEVASVGSGLTTETARRAGLSRRRKVNTTQPTGATLTLNV